MVLDMGFQSKKINVFLFVILFKEKRENSLLYFQDMKRICQEIDMGDQIILPPP